MRGWITALSFFTIAVAACGDNSNECGEGTKLDDDGFCVPTSTCGPGTVADTNGVCVPDGSVVCSDGTMFDTATGTCVPSSDVCGDGTVLIDGVCHDPATVVPNATESAETNDTSGAGTITVPATGAASFVVHGCIAPRSNGTQADLDPWFLSVTGPTVLEISADGLGGLSAGFAMVNADGNPALDDYIRFGINTSTDSAKRQLYLPAAGDYALIITDQRTLLGLGPAGNDKACYYASIKQVALPAPTTLTLPTTTAMNSGNVQVFRFASPGDGTIFKATMTSTSQLMTPAWVAVRNNAFHGLATDQGGFAPGPTRYVGNIANGQNLDIIVDMELNTAIAPQAFQIDSYRILASALDTTGTQFTVTEKNGTPNDPIVAFPTDDINYYYFDVGADDEVFHHDVTMTRSAQFVVFRTDIGDQLGNLDLVMVASSATSFSDQFIRYLAPGRYYVGFYDGAGSAGTTYDVNATLTPQTAPALAVGTNLTAEPISDVTGSAWRTVDPGTAKWLELTGGGANLGTGEDLEVNYYPDVEGWLDNLQTSVAGDIPSDFFFDQVFSADGTDAPVGRIAHNFPLRPFLVRLHSTGAPAAGQTFDYNVQARTFTDLNTVTEAAPVTMNDVMVPAGESVRFFVLSTGSTKIETIGANFDVAIERLDYDEFVLANADGHIAGDETLAGQRPQFGYVAFDLFNFDATDGTTTLKVSSLNPAPFTEICPSGGGTGTVLSQTGTSSGGPGDEGITDVQTLPFNFSLFGTSVNMYRVTANGFLSFDPAFGTTNAFFSNGIIPAAAAPNGVLAAYWDDLDFVEICKKDEANRTIIEWNGELFFVGTPVRVQASIYNTNNRVEFAYASSHVADGGSATSGAESVDGLQGTQLFRNSAGAVGPGAGNVLLLP